MKHILLTGQPKTGTTGLYNLVKDGLQPVAPGYYFLFEPQSDRPVRSILTAAPRLSVMTKMMFAPLMKTDLGREVFHRRVTTVRDPRDTVVSNLLFKPLVRRVSDVPMAAHERFLVALEEKERDPQRWSVRQLVDLALDVGYRDQGLGRMQAELATVVAYLDTHELYRLRYEDFVDGRVGGLAEYLEVPLTETHSGGRSWLDHISRSRTYGAWRHWFTAADVDAYRPILAGYLAAMGYDDEWALAAEPVIDPETSSRHVRQHLLKRQAELATVRRATTVADDGEEQLDGADLHTLWSMADDGNPHACVALARQLRTESAFGGPQLLSARHWARRAALQGASGSRVLLRELDTAPTDLDSETTGTASTNRGPRRPMSRAHRRARQLARRARRWISTRTGSGTGRPVPTT